MSGLDIYCHYWFKKLHTFTYIQTTNLTVSDLQSLVHSCTVVLNILPLLTGDLLNTAVIRYLNIREWSGAFLQWHTECIAFTVSVLGYTVKYGLSPRAIPRAQALFYRISRLESWYGHYPIPNNDLLSFWIFWVF